MRTTPLYRSLPESRRCPLFDRSLDDVARVLLGEVFFVAALIAPVSRHPLWNRQLFRRDPMEGKPPPALGASAEEGRTQRRGENAEASWVGHLGCRLECGALNCPRVLQHQDHFGGLVNRRHRQYEGHQDVPFQIQYQAPLVAVEDA